MTWKQMLSFVGQHALQGAMVAAAGLAASGTSPISKQGAMVMAAGALATAGNHLRDKPEGPDQ